MPPLTESAAEKLTPVQATAMVRVLELQANWEALLKDKAQKDNQAGLRDRQKAHDAFQVAWSEYVAKYRASQLPEPTHNVPDRLAVWCHTLRVVFQRAERGDPFHLMAKVYLLADQIAMKLGKEPVGRKPVVDLAALAAAIRELEVVIAWCDELVKLLRPSGRLLKAMKEEVA